MVLRSIEKGLPRARLLHCETPEDVIIWLRDWSNGFESMNHTFVQLLEDDIPSMVVAWDVFARSNNITTRNCMSGPTYEVRRWDFFTNKFDVVKRKILPSKNAFDDGKAFSAWVKQHPGFDADLYALLKRTCRFHEPRCTTNIVFYNLHQFDLVLQQVEKTIPAADLRIILLEGAMMIARPLNIFAPLCLACFASCFLPTRGLQPSHEFQGLAGVAKPGSGRAWQDSCGYCDALALPHELLGFACLLACLLAGWLACLLLLALVCLLACCIELHCFALAFALLCLLARSRSLCSSMTVARIAKPLPVWTSNTVRTLCQNNCRCRGVVCVQSSPTSSR
jgi:hypothetical protein